MFSCQISTNTHGASGEKRELKKFYQVVFLNKEDNCICIYTGFVVEKMDMVINFSADNVESVEHVDITDSFCDEKMGWVSVWGEQGQIIDANNFSGLVPSFITQGERDYIIKKNLHAKDLILISDNTKVFESLALRTRSSQNKNNSNANSFYNVNSSHGSLENVDFINWTKTQIKLQETRLDWRRFEYSLIFSKTNEEPRFTSEDFKIYFVLPEHHEIVFETGKSEQHFWGEEDPPEIEKNSFFKMVTDSSKYFREWKEQQNIEYRNYYKTTGFGSLKETNKKTIFEFEINSQKIRQVSNLVLTILVSLLIAFGLDHSRMSKPEVKPLFLYMPEIEYLFSAILIIFSKLAVDSLTTNNASRYKKRKIFLKWFYRISVFFFGVWLFLIVTASSNILQPLTNFTSEYLIGFFTSTTWARICFGVIVFLSLITIITTIICDKKTKRVIWAIFKVVGGSKRYQ